MAVSDTEVGGLTELDWMRSKLVVIVKTDVQATWVRKTKQGKIWLTECRLKVRVVEHPDLPSEWVCQMRDLRSVYGWTVMHIAKTREAATSWLHQT